MGHALLAYFGAKADNLVEKVGIESVAFGFHGEEVSFTPSSLAFRVFNLFYHIIKLTNTHHIYNL